MEVPQQNTRLACVSGQALFINGYFELAGTAFGSTVHPGAVKYHTH